MMIYNLKDFSFTESVSRLRVFIVIDEGEAHFRRIDEIGFGDDTEHGGGADFHHRKKVLS